MIRRSRRRTLSALALLFAVAFFWPVTTSVSGRTRIRLLMEGDTPVVGVNVRESWGVYGYGGKGGKDASVSDVVGGVEFPARKVTAFFGMRSFRRAGAFVTQCTHFFIFGRFGSRFTERWGPIVGIDIDLPLGNWLPASWPPATSAADDLAFAAFIDGPHRRIGIHNIDPLRPTLHISGDAIGFVGDTEIVVRIRHATPEEEGFIRENVGRQRMLKYMQTSK